MIQIHREHGFKSDQGVACVQKRHDKRVEGPVGTLRDEDFFHGVEITANNLIEIEFAVGLGYLVDEDRVAKRPRILVMPLIDRLHHRVDQELRRHQIRSTLAQRSAAEFVCQ